MPCFSFYFVPLWFLVIPDGATKLLSLAVIPPIRTKFLVPGGEEGTGKSPVKKIQNKNQKRINFSAGARRKSKKSQITSPGTKINCTRMVTPGVYPLTTLKKLEREITNSESMPHWPPVKGMLYFTEPSNTVSVESFSTRMS
jgi:hypothetical protein